MIAEGFAVVGDVISRARGTWAPPPKLTLSEWADERYVMSPETSAEPGRWHTLPYQRGIMDAMTDPDIPWVTLKKSARIGYTLMVGAAIGYHIDQAPSSMLVVQPTVDDAKNYSKESIAPLMRDVPVLRQIRFKDREDKGPKDSSNTLTHKSFPGGVLSLTGANSGTGLRRVSRRVILLDEVDAYPESAGSDGDPVELAAKRAAAFWNRKVICGSTPLVSGHSRIEELFHEGDQRHYYVPCPSCGHMDFLVFREKGNTGLEGRGHWMKWDEGKPEDAYFVCRKNGCIIEHKDKRAMVERGEWRAERPFRGHASFHIWSAYSYSPGAAWGQIALGFLKANAGGPEKLRTFVNTELGETWVEKGDAPEWERLYERREAYEGGTVPDGVVMLTAGVDVQRDRFVYEVVGWGADKQSWSIDADVITGNPSDESSWLKVEEILLKAWPRASGLEVPISVMAVDSGDNTQSVYNWARRWPGKVIAVKGSASQPTMLGAPKPVDVTFGGKRITRGCKVWPVGVDGIKQELYGWLRLPSPDLENSGAYPPGWCHFPNDDAHGQEFFKQLTAEQLQTVRTKRGFKRREWHLLAGRENHYLDCRVYARAAAARAGLDKMRRPPPPPVAAPSVPGAPPAPVQAAVPAPTPRPPPPADDWLGGRAESFWKR